MAGARQLPSRLNAWRGRARGRHRRRSMSSTFGVTLFRISRLVQGKTHKNEGRSIPPGVEGADNLCDLLVFVEDASGAVASADAEGLEVDGILGQRAQRCGLAEGAVGPVLVIEGLVLA